MGTSRNIQGSLFEEDYLRRTLGAVADVPDVALTELVANAWDAGASSVQITIPDEEGEEISIEDNGVGLTSKQFRSRWMTLEYSRVKHQGAYVEFPNNKPVRQRRAYGRNGIGRHGLLCFADDYTVETCREGVSKRFYVETTSGKDPFVLAKEEDCYLKSHGTRLSTRVTRNLPNTAEIRDIISARFLQDPEFKVYVNGVSVELSEHVGLIDRQVLEIADGIKVEVFFVDSSKTARRKQPHGIAFWVGPRLVGEPSWNLVFLDGRTSQAKRFTIIVRSDDLMDEVLPDWSGFKKSETMDALYKAVAEYVEINLRKLLAGRIQDTQATAFRDHKEELEELQPLARLELAEIVNEVTTKNPLVPPDFLSTVVDAVIKIEKTRSGKALLQKLMTLCEEDVEGLNKLLEDWSVRDALSVLDEIGRRICVVEALEKLVSDPHVDEVHTIHPLVTQAKWLFGPEFESPLYTSNVTIRKAVEQVFGKKAEKDDFLNHKKRPDLVILPDATLSAVATEEFDGKPLIRLRRVLLIELKRGGSTIGREAMTQAGNYVEDLLNCGLLDGPPYINAFVVGHYVDPKTQSVRKIGDPEAGRIEACSFDQLIRTANIRLFKLRERVSEQYKNVSGSQLIEQILKEPRQRGMFEEAFG